jgi:hypothetical protein
MGPGQEPPSQPTIVGMEPDLPSIQCGDQNDIERRGQQRIELESTT